MYLELSFPQSKPSYPYASQIYSFIYLIVPTGYGFMNSHLRTPPQTSQRPPASQTPPPHNPILSTTILRDPPLTFEKTSTTNDSPLTHPHHGTQENLSQAHESLSHPIPSQDLNLVGDTRTAVACIFDTVWTKQTCHEIIRVSEIAHSIWPRF